MRDQGEQRFGQQRKIGLVSVSVSNESSVPWVALSGELDLADANAVETELRRIWGLRDGRRLVLDLTELEFLDLHGARVLHLVATSGPEHAPPIVVPSARARRVLELLGFTSLVVARDPAHARSLLRGDEGQTPPPGAWPQRSEGPGGAGTKPDAHASGWATLP
jgi:anti-anti-sigma factor